MHGWREGERDSSLSTRVEVERQKNKEGIKKEGAGLRKRAKKMREKLF